MRSFNLVLLALAGTLAFSASASLAAPQMQNAPHEYSTGALAGRNMVDLYANYIGRGGPLPARVTINWQDRLAKLWQAKANNRHVKPVVRDLGIRLTTEYRTQDPGRMSLADYTAIANREARAMHASIDWPMVGRLYGLNAGQLSALRASATEIDGRMLVSYAMTELLPGRDQALNRAYLDFLLRNAGRRYVESIPALYDGLASFGPYQFTDKAIYDAHGSHVGASRMNLAVAPAMRIPGSTVLLRGNLHFRAAYLFAVNNLAGDMRKMPRKQVATLARVHASKRAELAQFVAVSHNKPAHGRRALREWLSHGARHKYIVYTSGPSRLYANKTGQNFQTLKAMPAHHATHPRHHHRKH